MQTELEMAKIYTASSVSFSRKIEGDCTQNYFNLTFWLNCPPLQAAFPTLHALAIRDCIESESNVIYSHQIL